MRYTLTTCYIACTAPGSKECPNAGHLYGCEVDIETEHTSTIQPHWQWNRQCASIAVSIYGPIYILMFAYAIIASAFWLLQTSAAAKILVGAARFHSAERTQPKW